MMAHESLALLTDLYQLTMAQAYFNDRKMDRATFSLFIRSYPLNRGFFISAGLHDVLKFLENFAVDGAALDYLSKQQLFTNDFLHHSVQQVLITSIRTGILKRQESGPIKEWAHGQYEVLVNA